MITGSFEGFSRDVIKEHLTTFGARVSETVSSKTDGVFVGTDPGSKFQKAQSLGIPILGESDVRELLAGSN